jgi:hypothetical protein
MRRIRVAYRVTSAGSPNTQHRDGSFVGLSSRGATGVSTAAGPNSSTGSARCHVGDNGLSLSQRATPQKPLRSAGSAPLHVALDPQRVTVGVGQAPGNRDPGRLCVPDPNRIGAVLVRLGRRAASVGSQCDRVVVTGVRRRDQSKVNGVRASAAAKHCRGRAPGCSPRGSRSPLTPQFGSQFPPPVRCTRVTCSCLPSPKRFWFGLLTPSQ